MGSDRTWMHAMVCLIGGVAGAVGCLVGCTAITPVEPQPAFVGSGDDTDTSTGPADTDSGTSLPYTEENIMPNPWGFSPMSVGPSYLQGSWYFYDNGTQDYVSSFYFTIDGDEGEYYLFPGGDGEFPSYSEDYRVSEIVVDGYTTDYLAVGFEVCSTRQDEEPFEFPFVLGHCTLVNPDSLKPFETHGADHFLGISFEFVPGSESDFSRIEVLFRQWGSGDSDDPYCVVYNPEVEHPPSDAAECESVPNADETGYIIYAEARNAKSDVVDDALNISMLQAIHIEVYGEAPATMSFRLSDVKVRSASDPQGDVAPADDLATDCPEFETPVTVDETYEPGWVAPLDWSAVTPDAGAVSPFLIMKEEVSVEQFHDCIDAGACAEVGISVPIWETCNVALHDNVSGDDRTDLLDRAANCVGWCHARRFCEWVGGSLPTEEQWQIAAWGALDGSGMPKGVVGNCEDAVVNDEDNGVGCGDRMPAEGCSKLPNAGPNDLCDMAGNLWEWIEDEAEVTDEAPWREGYRKLKGGSLNSSEKSKALEVSSSTIEHPVVPHSPTRLGFRCVTDLAL